MEEIEKAPLTALKPSEVLSLVIYYYAYIIAALQRVKPIY